MVIQQHDLAHGVKSFSTTVDGGVSALDVAAGTTGYVGGDSSRSFFGLKEVNCPGTTTVKVEDESLDFSVEFYGDSELRAMIGALKFIVQTLEGLADKKQGKKSWFENPLVGMDTIKIAFGQKASIRAGIPKDEARPLHWQIVNGELVCSLWGFDSIKEEPSRMADCIAFLKSTFRRMMQSEAW